MRIAYVCADAGVPVFGTKGCSVHVQEVVRQLLRLNHTVTLFAVRQGGDVCFAGPKFEWREIELQSSPDVESRELQQRSAANQIADQMDAYEFDLVYERYSLWSAQPILRSRELGIPSVLEVNAPLIEEQMQHRRLDNLELAISIRDQVFAAATTIVAVSEGVAEYVKSHLPRASHGKVHVVSNGVDTNRFRPDVPPIGSSSDFTIGFLGTIKPWHGLESLLAAFHLLHTNRSNVRLRIIGDGPMRETLRDLVSTEYSSMSSSIDWIGEVRPVDVPSYLTSLNVAVAPYLASAQFYFSPLKVFEYMACGRAIAASSIGQIASIIDHGTNGMLYPPGDVNSLFALLMNLADKPDLVESLGYAARQTALRLHSWQHVLESVLNHVRDDCMSNVVGEPFLANWAGQ